ISVSKGRPARGAIDRPSSGPGRTPPGPGGFLRPGVGSSGTSRRRRASLLVRLWAGQAGAWERLVRLYGQTVYVRCRGAGVSEADAADVSQEVFATAGSLPVRVAGLGVVRARAWWKISASLRSHLGASDRLGLHSSMREPAGLASGFSATPPEIA